MGLLSRLVNVFSQESRHELYELGFHGDSYLLKVVDPLAKNSDMFLETGTNVGSTLGYMARTYSHMKCYSCEPDISAYKRAVTNVDGYDNATIFNLGAIDFLKQMMHMNFRNSKPLVWLDAHGQGFEWPLQDEIRLITNGLLEAFVLIDDFEVPGQPQFKFDTYGDQVCNFNHIVDFMAKDKDYQIAYPSYVERTSDHHPLTGWVLISFGKDDLSSLLQSCTRLLSIEMY